MADHLERALLAAEIAELRKQQSEIHINAIYVGSTGDEWVTRQMRDARIGSLRLQLAALDGKPGIESLTSLGDSLHATDES